MSKNMNQQTHDKYKVMFDQRYIGGIIKNSRPQESRGNQNAQRHH